MIKKGKELEPGEVIKKLGIILEVNINPNNNDFWNGKSNIYFYCMRDPYYGPVGMRLDIDINFEVITDREEIIKIYKEVNSGLSRDICDKLRIRDQFIKVKETFFARFYRGELYKNED